VQSRGEMTPRQGITEEYLAHAINHTCHPDFENCTFLHTGVTKDPRGVGQEDEEGVEGSRTRVVFVQAKRRVEREEEFFANYGDSFRFPHGCQCSAICVRRWRHVATSCGQFRVRTDLVQRDIFTVQYNFFNFGVIKFISDVNPHNLGVNINPNNVNQV
jgi:hypothetical protein